MFKSLTKTHMLHVPYRGASQALTALIAGDVQVMFMTPPASMPYIEGGKIRALAYTGEKRFARLPGLPTMAEAGMPGRAIFRAGPGCSRRRRPRRPCWRVCMRRSPRRSRRPSCASG